MPTHAQTTLLQEAIVTFARLHPEFANSTLAKGMCYDVSRQFIQWLDTSRRQAILSMAGWDKAYLAELYMSERPCPDIYPTHCGHYLIGIEVSGASAGDEDARLSQGQPEPFYIVGKLGDQEMNIAATRDRVYIDYTARQFESAQDTPYPLSWQPKQPIIGYETGLMAWHTEGCT